MCKKLFPLLVIVLALCMAGCGSSNTPSAVAEKAVNYLKDGNYEAYAELFYHPENATPEEVEKQKQFVVSLFKEKYEKSKKQNGGIKSFEILSEEVDEEAGTATVSLVLTYEDGSTDDSELTMKKDEKGDWKLNMSK